MLLSTCPLPHPGTQQVLAGCAGKGSFPGAGWVSQGRLGITETGKAMRGVKGNTKATPGQDGGGESDIPGSRQYGVELRVDCVVTA